jgi:hypothetical protein
VRVASAGVRRAFCAASGVRVERFRNLGFNQAENGKIVFDGMKWSDRKSSPHRNPTDDTGGAADSPRTASHDNADISTCFCHDDSHGGWLRCLH